MVQYSPSFRKVPFSDEGEPVARSPRPGGKEVTFRVSRGIGISLARLGKSDPNLENFDSLIHRRQSSAPPRSGHFSRVSTEKPERRKVGRSDADMRAKRRMSGKRSNRT